MPIYPSPLKDDGYDIADFLNIDEAFGTIDDFKGLLKAAHERGLRIIMDLVMNHTSIEHPCSRPPGLTGNLRTATTMSGAIPTRSTKMPELSSWILNLPIGRGTTWQVNITASVLCQPARLEL